MINPAGSADPRFQVTTLEAARRVSGASGIALVFDGTTDRTAAGWLSERHPSSGPRVLVAWAGDPEAIGAGARTVVGTASTAEDDNRDGQLVYVAGLIRLASWHDLPPEEWLAVQMHEWGHTLGLAHASDPRSVMYPEVGTTEWSAGDRAGLRAVGRASGCLLDANP